MSSDRKYRRRRSFHKKEGWWMPGHVTRKGNGFYVRIYIGREDGKDKYRWSQGFASKREAESWREQQAVFPLYGAGRGRNARGRERFRDYAAHWLKDRQTGATGRDPLRPKTLQTYGGLLSKHVLPHIGWVPPDKFDDRRIKQLLADLRTEGKLGGTSIHHVYRLLHVMFADALSDGLIVKSPMTFRGPSSTIPTLVAAGEASPVRPAGRVFPLTRHTPSRRPRGAPGGTRQARRRAHIVD